jgi:tRNA nucleotidyltransferase (CCA-adding enzyme)
LNIDVSLSRIDSKIDVGHRGFEVKTDPYMSIEDAARRRDFTMNSIAADPLTGKIYDPFGGIEDIKNGILKITDHERFRDDPLRVLRALQFVGRFGLEIDKDSILIIQEMASQLKELPKERIGEEWKKLLLKSKKPSLGLSAGMILGVFKEIHPEFPPLVETQQEKEWHPEGNVWIHTLMVVDEAAKIIQRERLESNNALTVLLGALCHDLGKPMVTEYKDGRIISYEHETVGEEPTKKFLATIKIDNLMRDKVIKLVTNHLIPTMFYVEEVVRNNKISDGAIRRLANRIYPATIQELVFVSEADHLGRGLFDQEIKEQLLLPENQFPVGEWLLKRARDLEVEDSRPADLTRSRDWISLGYKRGENIGKLIRLSNSLRDEKKFSREMVFGIVDKINNSDEVIKKLEKILEKNRKVKYYIINIEYTIN